MHKYLHPVRLALSAAVLASLSLPLSAQAQSITRTKYGNTTNGQQADLFTLTNARGMKVGITNYGGVVVSIIVPDRNGQMGDVALGFDTLAEYQKSSPYFGALVGRYANRISGGKFKLNGRQYTLATNNGPNHLHGGNVGWDKKVWNARAYVSGRTPKLELRYLSRNGEEGYPGNVNTRVVYSLTPQNEIRIDYRAVTDAPTVINLTHHSYFNLKGAGLGDILSHQLTLFGSRYLPTGKTSIPTGEKARVAGTPFDFLTPHTIGERIGVKNQQLEYGQGYDHNFILNGRQGRLRLAARVYEPSNGRVMTVSTTEPGLQLYTGNFLTGEKGKYGRNYVKRGGFCLEAQNFPDAPNQESFPSAVLTPGETYRQTTIYKFSTR